MSAQQDPSAPVRFIVDDECLAVERRRGGRSGSVRLRVGCVQVALTYSAAMRSPAVYSCFVMAVALVRLVEIRISRQRACALAEHGVATAQSDQRWMILIHVGILIGAVVEVWLASRPFLAVLAVPMLAIFLAATALRWWVIGTLGPHWNLGIMDSMPLGIVADGPYRWIRHPNAVAVFLEYAAIPLIHSAWITALIGAAWHASVLRRRIIAEERVLLRHPAYRQTMGRKPRLLPGGSGDQRLSSRVFRQR